MGKGGLGYKVLASGKGLLYLAITMPHGMGFKKGDRVFMKPMVLSGVYGVFVTSEKPRIVPVKKETLPW
jgi:hypothetical protein